MRDELTITQADVYGWLIHFHAVNEYMPSRVEIANEFGWASANAAHEVLSALAKKGYITLVPSVARGIRIND